jgi:putative transcriptional regulator
MSNLMHHPTEDTLLAYAAGTLDEPTSILVATHLSLCPECRRVVQAAEAIGGELMEALRPTVQVATTADDLLLRLSETKVPVEVVDKHKNLRVNAPANSNTANTLLPSPLRAYVPGGIDTLKWQWMGPGVRYARILDDGHGAKVGLMRIASGTRMPNHGHTDDEYTLVLAGGYRDAFGSYQRGDVETATNAIQHQPVADPDGDCICLVVTRGELKPTGMFARVLQPLMRM